ncbi:SUMO1 sentrin specific peptidase 8 [Homalodisca vitripennis]|nr:SUMO1 sentrin specific peptidase 8 [Homalodisca vitripennis]
MNCIVKKCNVPKGWKREEVMRKTGVNKGKIDVNIISPKGKIFRSQKELSQYILDKKLSVKIEDFNFSQKCLNSQNENVVSFASTPIFSGELASEVDEGKNQLHLNNTPVSMKQNDLPNTNLQHTHISTQTEKNFSISLPILSNDWILDDSIDMYFEILYLKKLVNNDVCLVKPAVCQAIKYCKYEDLDFITKPLSLDEKAYIVLPVSDAAPVMQVAGSHWSLLLYVKSNKTFYYLDSVNQYNIDSAKLLFDRISKYLSPSESTKFKILDCPQQKNNIDCGVYLLLMVDWFIKGLHSGASLVENYFDQLEIKEKDVILKRALLAYLMHNHQYTKLSRATINALILHPSCQSIHRKPLLLIQKIQEICG